MRPVQYYFFNITEISSFPKINTKFFKVNVLQNIYSVITDYKRILNVSKCVKTEWGYEEYVPLHRQFES
jgi:hypothetical protein